MKQKSSGILLHITSLPGNQAVGTLGSQAHVLLETLHDFNQNIWQILPIHPTNALGSPFQSSSVFAGNPFLIDLEMLLETGDLSEEEFQSFLHHWNAYDVDRKRSNLKVDFDFLWKYKLNQTLVDAFWGFSKKAKRNRLEKYQQFCKANYTWLEPFANFMALKDWYGREAPWSEWDKADKYQQPKMKNHINPDVVEMLKYLQFVFHEQMLALRQKAASLGVELIGDLPMYPDYDSADVWSNQELFQLNKSGKMTAVAGVPPDYFSKNGQLWDSPLYNWSNKKTVGEAKLFSWWAKRIKRELEYLDTVKLDHFRAFVAYGKVSAKSKTAKNAHWVPAPGERFFHYLHKTLGKLPIICEDLGIVSPNVRKLQKKVGPGMRVFVFIDPSQNLIANHTDPNLPHNLFGESNTVFYTGTHDNETLSQWLGKLNNTQRENLSEYLASQQAELSWKVIDRISKTEAAKVIFPMQDILGLGKEARMNRPGIAHNQWTWRMTEKDFKDFINIQANKLVEITKRNQR